MAVTKSHLSSTLQTSRAAEVNSRETRKRQRSHRHKTQNNNFAEVAEMKDNDSIMSTSTQNEVQIESKHNGNRRSKRKTEKVKIQQVVYDDNDDDDDMVEQKRYIKKTDNCENASHSVNTVNGDRNYENTNQTMEHEDLEHSVSINNNSSDDSSNSENERERQENANEHNMSEDEREASNGNGCAVVEETIENQLHEINPPTLKLICTMHEQLKACVTAERSLKDLLATRKHIRSKVKELCESRDAATLNSYTLSHSSPFALSSSKSVVVVRLNVGGELFVVPVSTLLDKDDNTYFHLLFGLKENRPDLPESPLSLSLSKQMKCEQNVNAMSRPHTLPGVLVTTTTTTTTATTKQQNVTPVAVSEIEKANSVNNCTKPITTTNVSNSITEKEIKDNDDTRSSEYCPYAHLLEQCGVNQYNAPLFVDETGAIFIDRDPATFRYILSYLRGYTHLKALDEDVLNKVKVDARYFQLHGLLELLGETNKRQSIRFLAGPGVNPEGTRLRVIYGIATIGQNYMLAGRHRITFEVCRSDYVGLGVVSDACVNADQEFHRTPNCCVYYMSGVFYSNFPHHRKEENLARFENGEFVTIDLDMDKRVLEFTLKNSKKILSIGQARRLRFAVTMKLSSVVRIVSNVEYERICKEQSSSMQVNSPLNDDDELQIGEEVAQRQVRNHDRNQINRIAERMALQSEILHSNPRHYAQQELQQQQLEQLERAQREQSSHHQQEQQQQQEQEELLLLQELQGTEHLNSVWDVDDETADLHSLFYDEMYDS